MTTASGQAPPALPAGVVLPVQSPQPPRRSGSLLDQARCRVRHHHLRPAQSRRYAGRCHPCPPPSRNSWATCFSRIGNLNKFFCGLAAFEMSAGLSRLYGFFQHSVTPSLHDFDIIYRPAMILSTAFLLSAVYCGLSDWASSLKESNWIKRLDKLAKGA